MAVSPEDRESLARREAMVQRLKVVRAQLLDEPTSAAPGVDRLAQDVADQKAGRLPDFMRRKLAAQERGEHQPMARDPQADRGRMPPLMRDKLRPPQTPRPAKK